MSWTPPYLINYSSDGDTVYGGVVKCDNNIADAYAKLTILDTYRTEDHADIGVLELAFDGLQSDLNDVAGDLAQTMSDLDTLEGSVSTLSGVVSGHTTSIGTLDSTVSSHTTTISSHTSTLSSHTSSISGLASSVSTLTSNKVDKGTANTISAAHTFSGNPVFSGYPVLSGTLLFTAAGTGWKMYQTSTNFMLDYNSSNKFKLTSDGKLWSAVGADFDGTVYADDLDTDNHGTGQVVTRTAKIRYSTAGAYCDLTANSAGSLAISPNGTVAMYVGPSEVITMNATTKIYNQQAGGHLYCDYIDYGTSSSHTWTIDTADPVNDRWELLATLVDAYTYHDSERLHKALQKESIKTVPTGGRSFESLTEEEKWSKDSFEEIPTIGRSPDDCIQLAVECIYDLTLEIDELREQLAKTRTKFTL